MSDTEDMMRRHATEKHFHDEKYSGTDLYPKHYGVNPTYAVFQRMKKMCGDLRDKRVLEFGCGEGWTTCELAALGAHVSGFDISAKAVEQARALIERQALSSRCEIREMSAEKLDYPNESCDVVIGFSILHHLDLKLAMPEIFRVMKTGGMACFAEPLGGNPLINLYRKLTPKYRTPDERPIRLAEFHPVLNGFKDFRHREYYFLAIASLALVYLPFGRKLYPFTNRVLVKLDDVVLHLLPFLGSWAWYSIFTWRK